jgi:hypothetical protein
MSALRTVRRLRILALLSLAFGTAEAGTISTTDGTVTVTDVVTPIGSLFQYDYTVTDGTGELAVLDIAVTPGIDISGLTAPGGAFDFTSTVDTVNTPTGPEEFVSFLENNGVFSSTPESGFIFDSTVAPSASTFDVTLFDGTTGSGSVQAPVVTPEPSSLALCVLAGAALLFWRKRSPASVPNNSKL